MRTSFDPDEMPPAYDDRAPLVVKTPDPVVQRRTKNNRKRGKKAEVEWSKLINDVTEGELAVVMGVLGNDDVRWGNHSFEVKHKHMGWPSNTVIKNALVQAAKNAGNRTPVVVCCMTTHNSRSWRVYSAVGVYVDGRDWLSEAQKAEGAA